MAVYDIPYSVIQLQATPAFPNGRIIKRPVVVVTIMNGPNKLSCLSIVDSGADYCAFPRSFMQPLGLDPLSAPMETTNGVSTSGVPTHFCNVGLDFGVIQVQAYAGFTIGLDQIGFGLLGQSGFFERFNVTFRHAQSVFQVEVP